MVKTSGLREQASSDRTEKTVNNDDLSKLFIRVYYLGRIIRDIISTIP